MAWKESASHIPVLVSLSQQYPFDTVLEVGSGSLSTSLFLEPSIYPELELLISIEDDLHWRIRMLALHGDDPRYTSLPEYTAGDAKDFDLVFFDGPQDKLKRIALLPLVSKDCELLVVHDTENEELLKAIDTRLSYRYTFNWIAPHTTIASRYPFDAVKLQRHEEIMKIHFNDIEEDWFAWFELFNRS